MKRRIALIMSALALHSSWGPELKWLCNPVLSCHSCVLAWFACPIGVFVHYSGYHLFPFFALGTLLVIGVIGGRLLCGWVCPFGLLQDLLYKVSGPKINLPEWTSRIKYIVLAFMVFIFPFLWSEQTWLSFCRICPAAALQVTLPALLMGENVLNAGTLLRFLMLGMVIVLAIVNSRSFCKVICPIGALMAPLNLISFWVVKPPRESCLNCLKCDQVCSTNVRPSERLPRHIPANRALDCIVCHDCQSACESTFPAPRADVSRGNKSGNPSP